MSCPPQNRLSIQCERKPTRTHIRLDILDLSQSARGGVIQVLCNAG